MTIFNNLGQKIADFFGENSPLDSLTQEKVFSSDFLEPDYLADLLPYRLFDAGRKIYENKSSLGFVIEALPLGGSLEAQKELSALIGKLGEEGSNIQCLLVADYRIDRFLQEWAEPRKEKGNVYKEMALKRELFFKRESLEGEVPPRIFRFFFSYSQPKPLEKDLPMVLDRILEKKKEVLETFKRLRTPVFEVLPLQLIEMLSGFINYEPGRDISPRKTWNKDTWLSKQVCVPGSALEVKKEGLVFHSKNDKSSFRSYEVVDFPDHWSLPYTGELIGDFFNKSYRIPSPFYLHYGIHFPKQAKTELKFRARAKMVDHQMKFSSLIKMLPYLPRENEENLMVNRQLLEGDKFVETRFICGLWAEQSRFTKSESILMALFQKYGFKLKENHFIHLPDLLSSLPMSWGEDAAYMQGLKRMRSLRTTLSQETGCLIPCVGEWWGNSSKGMVLTGRRGQIACWDLFASEGNLNTVVIGPSGSGKSVFMQEMIMSHLGQGGRVFVLDLGRSFEKLCHLLDGQHLTFSEKSQLNLNPFNFVNPQGGIDSINAALEMVSSIVATMAMPFQKMDKERVDIINTLVKKVWEKIQRGASLDDVIAFLDDLNFHSELMIGATESLKESLRKYGSSGVYSNYFYGSHSVDFTNDFVVIETEELKNMADLQAVILQIFTLAISNQVFLGDRNKRCLICIDEAWDLLKSPQMEGFIESLARRLRKYNGALVVGTQGIKDFERSHGAKAAFQNSNWLVMLGKDNDSINILKKDNLILLDEFKEMALASLQMEEGKYSEAFIYNKGTGSFSINQLKLDPFSVLLYSTRADEFQAIQELKNQGLSVAEALDWLLSHKSEFKRLLQQGNKVKEALVILLKNRGKNGC